MNRYKLASALLLGVVVGMAWGDEIEDPALAAGSGCAAWQIQQWDGTLSEQLATMPEGWEPFATFTSFGEQGLLRRCAK